MPFSCPLSLPMNSLLVVIFVGSCSVIGANGLAFEKLSSSSTTTSLRAIEATVQKVLRRWPGDHSSGDHDNSIYTATLDRRDRETFGVAKHLDERIQAFRRNGDCERCWLQHAHCICHTCPPLETTTTTRGDILQTDEPRPLQRAASIRRIFVLMHHKEICLVVDTAKLIAVAFPHSCRLVVGGIGPRFQDSMKEMLHCLVHEPSSCIVLFPSEQARTYNEIVIEQGWRRNMPSTSAGWNVIVLDGTWEQARKLHKRYLLSHSNAASLLHVKLSDASLGSILPVEDVDDDNDDESLNRSSSSQHGGMQLRRHPEQWRQISTLAATRLLLTEMTIAHDEQGALLWDKLADYQRVADEAARKQLGPIRHRQT